MIKITRSAEMRRREFLAVAGVAGAAALGETVEGAPAPRDASRRGEAFKLKYAPHFGLFSRLAGNDDVDQLRFMADEGFRAFEDNGMMRRAKEQQERIARTMTQLGLEMGVFVAHADFGAVTFAADSEPMRARLLKDIDEAVETAKRVNARWCTVVLGRYDPSQDRGYQTANVIDNLKRCAERCEPSGLVMVLEPLNPRDHPGLFLTKISQAAMICRAVDSPSCRILDDLYHQQVTEGNLIPNIDQAWNEIAYFQVGDNPGRNEPTTGEINFRNVFRYIHQKGFDGIVGMEHGLSRDGKEGERAVIEAYRECDAF